MPWGLNDIGMLNYRQLEWEKSVPSCNVAFYFHRYISTYFVSHDAVLIIFLLKRLELRYNKVT